MMVTGSGLVMQGFPERVTAGGKYVFWIDVFSGVLFWGVGEAGHAEGVPRSGHSRWGYFQGLDAPTLEMLTAMRLITSHCHFDVTQPA